MSETTSVAENVIEDTFNLLEEGSEMIELSKNKNVSFLFGTTGSQKNAFAQYIAGDNSKLLVEKVNEKFTFKDEKKTIGDDTVSKTIFPELLGDVITSSAFYNCPDFDDNRSVSMDIASTFFIKKVFDHVDCIKIILVVNYSALLSDNHRDYHLKKLLVHVCNLIQDIQKFKDSIALVVTNVPYEYEDDDDGNSFEIPEERMIGKIILLMQDFSSHLEISRPFTSNQKLLDNAITLMKILQLKDKEGEPQRICIFRVPNEGGPVSTNKKMQSAKESILKVLHKNILFAPKNQKDFGFTVSDASKNEIHNLVKNLYELEAEKVKLISEEIVHGVNKKTENTKDIRWIHDYLHKVIHAFTIATLHTSLTTPKYVIKRIHAVELEIKFSVAHLISLNNFDEYLRHFQIFSKELIPRRPFVWIKPLIDAQKHFENIKNWFNFLITLNGKLSYYEIQQEKLKYNFENKITKNNFNQFLEKSKNLGLSNFTTDSSIVDESKLKLLNEILEKTLKSTPEVLKTQDKVIIKGNFIKLSECSKDYANKKIIKIFALDTVFIDKDIIAIGEEKQLTIIAPKWHIVGQRLIDLSGQNARETFPKKAKSGQNYGESGEHGKNGSPGGAAGNFYGIGKYFFYGQNLNIKANGGNGSSGQDGGDGYKGKDGVNAKKPRDDEWYPGKSDVQPDDLLDELDFRWNRIDPIPVSDCHIIHNRHSLNDVKTHKSNHFFRIYGKAATNAGHRGNGGMKGLGAQGGNIKMVSLAAASNIKISNDVGKDGIYGKDGQYGDAGINGDDIILACYYYTKGVTRFINWHILKTVNGGLGETSKSGVNFGSTMQTINRKDNPWVETYSQTLNEYKVYLIQAFCGLDIQNLKSFFQNLFTNSEIVSVYNTYGFIDEAKKLLSIEGNFEKNILIESYELHLSNVALYANKALKKEDTLTQKKTSAKGRFNNHFMNILHNLKNKPLSSQHKKALSYVYAAILSKICVLKEDLDNNLITNIKDYLESEKNTIEQLEKLGTTVAIDQYKSKYNERVDAKIEEANEFIKNQIKTEIDAFGGQVKTKISDLVHETIELQKKTKIEKRELIEKRQQLETELLMSSIFGIFGLVGQALGFLGSFGQVTTSAINVATSMTKALTTGKTNGVNIVEVPQAIKSSLESVKLGMELFNNRKLKKIDQQLEILSSQPDKNAFVDTVNFITTKQNQIKELRRKNQLSTKQMNQFDQDIKQHLIKKKESLIGKKSVAVVNRLIQATEIADAAVQIYSQFQSGSAELEQIDNAIEASKNKLKQLYEYEDRIHDTLTPMVDSIQQGIVDLEGKLGSQSQVALDVSKWKVQGTLLDLKHILKQFTEGFRVQGEMLLCIEKLQETMNTLIIIYDRIQNYNDQKALADYIANVASASFKQIAITDENLRIAITDLEIVSKSNIILSEYQHIMNAIKLSIFPFAELFLEEITLPTALTLKKSTDESVVEAVNRMQAWQNKFIKFDASLLKQDAVLINTHFNPKKDENSKPFFIWKNSQHQDSISKLLSGNEVTFTADVMKGLKENVVKFNQIKISFRVNNTELQGKIESVLERYEFELTHLGNSYYKCNDEIFMFTSQKQTFIASFAEENGKSRTFNQVYSKIMNSYPILSPYAMWSIKLKKIQGKNFDDLKMFKNQVDLELIGYGQYIRDNYVFNKKLQYFYSPDTSFKKALSE